MTSVGSLFVADRQINDIVTQFGMNDSIYWKQKKDEQGLNCFFAML